MKSKTKKVLLPSVLLVILVAAYIATLGSPLAIILAIPMSLSATWLLVWNGERWLHWMNEWANRDDGESHD